VDTLTALDALRAKVADTREAFERAASASYLHDDPAKDQLLAMGLAMDAMLQICEINDASQKNVTASLGTQIKEIAGKATQQLVEQAGPDVADAIESATRFHLKTVRLRSILGGAAGVLVGAALIAGFSYSAGFESGQTNGEIASNTVAAGMATGPAAAAAWSSIMADNDPVQDLLACKKSVAIATDGRHYCSMPVWLDHKFRQPDEKTY
jgi:hypothetical protein